MNQKRSFRFVTASTVMIWLFLFADALNAQRPGWAIGIHPLSGDSLRLDDIWRLDVANQESEPMEITLFGEVFEERQGDMFHGRSNNILIPPGGKRLSSEDVVKIDDGRYNAEFKNAVERTRCFPTGNYTICMTVVAPLTGRNLGHQCVRQSVAVSRALRLMRPAEGEEIRELSQVFKWSRPSSPAPESSIFYRFKIFEVRQGQTPAEASHNPAVFERDGLKTDSLQFPSETRRFEAGRRYGWQVQTVDELGTSIGLNETGSFVYRPERIPEHVKVQFPLPDTLVIGGFHLAVEKDSVTVTGQKLSGKATGQFLTPPPCASDTGNTVGAFDDGSGLIMIPGPTVYSATDFEVEFKNLETTHWPPQKVEKVASGSISHSFSTPLRLVLDDFTVSVARIRLEGDSAYAALRISPAAKALGRANSCDPPGIEAEDVSIDKYVRFDFSRPDFSADSLVIGNTGILFRVRGVEARFRQTPGTIVFDAGETLPQKPAGPDNSAFLMAGYYFTRGRVIACEGFKADMRLKNSWQYETLIPADFSFTLKSGELSIEKSWVREGIFAGTLDLPKSLTRGNSSRMRVALDRIEADSLLNLSGGLAFDGGETLRWGGFQLSTDSARIFFPGGPDEFSLTALDTASRAEFTAIDPVKAAAHLKTMPGLTVDLLKPADLDTFQVHSPDKKLPLTFAQRALSLIGWLNLSTQGITGRLQTKEKMKLLDVSLGLPGKKGYKSESPFAASLWHQPDSLFWVEFQFVRNAVYASYLGGTLTIPYPCAIEPKFKDMEVTSTAELVGGDVFFKQKELAYWGVTMTAQKTGNVVSADLGEIVYMNSTISEEVHFSQPFKIIWGEMLADGGLGKFIFDLGSPQKFDGFLLTLHAAGLSKYNSKKTAATADTLGYLRAFGDLHFDFFGAHRMDVRDYKDARTGHGADAVPYYGRFVALGKKNCELHFDKKWGSGTAQMVFDVDYDNNEASGYTAGDQNGFRGDRQKTNVVHFWLTPLTGKQTLIPDDIDLNSVSSFFSFCEAGNLDLMSADAQVATVGGLIQIKGDALKRIYFEGLSNIKGWVFQKDTRASLEITPNNTTFAYRGSLCLMVVKCGLVGMVSTRFVVDKKNDNMEGDLSGVLKAYSGGSNLLLATTPDYLGIEAKGRLNFFISPDTNYVQGYAKVSLEWGVKVACEGAFFVGIHAPTEKIWVLDVITKGPSIRDRLEQNFPSLSGFYCAGLFTYGYDFKLFEVDFTLYAGLGFFADPNNVTMVGHGGVQLEASLLQGVLSASAWTELYSDLVVGNSFDLCMQGTVGIEACLVCLCVDFDMTFHFNKYGFGLNGCN